MSTRSPEPRTAARPARRGGGVTAATLHGLDRADAGLVALLLALASAAWVLTDQRMGGMAAAPGTELGGVGWFTVSWLLMMAAMMLPSLVPAAPTTGAPAFVAGYLSVWTVAGLAGYLAVEGIRAVDLGWLAWDRAGRYVAAGVILAAAAYQLSPVKGRYLRRCRDRAAGTIPSRPGFGGALQAGIEHGGHCVGCCWALMAALLALGIMSLVWMAVIAALITAERLLPRRALAATAVAVALTALGLAVALVPGDVPGLTLPGPADGMGAMGA